MDYAGAPDGDGLALSRGEGFVAGDDQVRAVIGFTNQAPTANLAAPAPGSQFPPR
jgi:hypothetical protein